MMSNTPVLALLDFSKVFVVEVETSEKFVGAVLMQDHDDHLIGSVFQTKNSMFSPNEI